MNICIDTHTHTYIYANLFVCVFRRIEKLICNKLKTFSFYAFNFSNVIILSYTMKKNIFVSIIAHKAHITCINLFTFKTLKISLSIFWFFFLLIFYNYKNIHQYDLNNYHKKMLVLIINVLKYIILIFYW